MSEENVEASDAKKEKNGKSNLVPAVVLAVGIAVGGYFMGGSGDAGGDKAAAKEKPQVEKPVPGQIATMEPLSVNLAAGHFLKVGIALQLIEGIESGEFMKGDIAKAKDLLIERIGGLPMDQLTSPDGRKKVKDELTTAAKKLYDNEVLDVYFTDFVMQ